MMATGPLLLALSITALAWGVHGKKDVSGSAAVYLGQSRDAWRPLIHITVNLTKIRDIKSSFQLRTYDPEGIIFYGDTKDGKDWFILSLKDGIPLMQLSRSGVLVNVAGGPKLNDGRWHTLELSNHGHFVILDVDGSRGLFMGVRSDTSEEVISGSLRLALGGILIPRERLFVEFEPQMDACVREGRWLNLSIPWETDAEELRPCYENIRPGSFFPGNGLAIVNASAVLQVHRKRSVTIELWGDFTKMDGTILSVRTPGQPLMFSLSAHNDTKKVTVLFGGHVLSVKDNFKKLAMIFRTGLLEVRHGGDESHFLGLPENSGLLDELRGSRIAIGGLLGEDDAGSHFLKGCLEKVQIQGKDVDFDRAIKHQSISSHSCPI
ncbi:sex hormone-binding globulin isoform X1 [Syngnathus typhle]|uniref:sex hormone-binding globulin isoform X1 n=1 Tax=Syngnathus typhle TaxID=161592 RepID=UPI002A69DD4D|nr:sex hormone-binding globulin isoform X1 [Syngnathus typhle]XP_061131593.1 sex hormone-binding globulin isoform X1 [Syngnathus typhle]